MAEFITIWVVIICYLILLEVKELGLIVGNVGIGSNSPRKLL